MSNSSGELKHTLIGVAAAWLITMAGAWVTYTNTITELQTQQTAMMKSIDDLRQAKIELTEKVEENTRNGAVTTSVLNRLNDTLTNIDGSLDIIVEQTTRNTVEIENLKKQKGK